MDGYDYRMFSNDVLQLKQQYPFLNVNEIGKSLCGRSLYLISIGIGEPILLAGCFHGMEHITTAVLMNLLKETSVRFARGENIASVNTDTFFKKRKVCFVPCVNPDGVEISLHGAQQAGDYAEIVKRFSADEICSWQANARGVDLNHNFNAEWEKLKRIEIGMGINAPAPTRFGGYFAESEPEVMALKTLCEKKKFRRVMACHSQGEEIFYSFGKRTPPESLTAAKRMAALSGYRINQPEGEIASYGGFKDWFIQNYGRMGFTVELGKGKNPLPVNKATEIYRKTKEMFFEFMIWDF